MLNLIFACEFLYKNYIYNMIPKLEFLFFSVNRLYNNFCVNITYFHQYQSHLCVFMPMSYNCVNVKVICVYPCQCQISVSMLRSSLSINVKVNYLCEWQWVFSSELQQHWNLGLWQSPKFVNLVCFLKNGIVVQYFIIKMAQNLWKEIRFAW